MRKQTLHELAKFFSGLVLADMIVGLWAASQGLLPLSFLGITVTQSMLAPWLLFDAGVFIILIHYGWHIGKTPLMRERTYLLTASVIFGLIALAHLVRAFTGSDFVVLGWAVPLWLSWFGVAATAYLSYMSAHLALRMR